MRKLSWLAVLAITLTPTAGVLANDEPLARAVAASHRTSTFVERDKYRRPLQELQFFGLKADQTVVEIAPGGGYWTEILAPYLRDKGTFYTVVSPQGAENWQKKLGTNADLYGKVKVTTMGADSYELAPAG